MQNIYDGLDEANSILQRFYNRQAPAQSADVYASAQSPYWLESYHETAEAEKQPVVLNVFSGDRSAVHQDQIHPSMMQAIDIGLDDFEAEMRGGRGPGQDLSTMIRRDTQVSPDFASAIRPVQALVSAPPRALLCALHVCGNLDL